jgi:hypothetical protein
LSPLTTVNGIEQGIVKSIEFDKSVAITATDIRSNVAPTSGAIKLNFIV